MRQIGLDVYRYLRYSTGHYVVDQTGRKEPGVTMQFQSVLTDESHAVTFNAELRYARSKGDARVGQLLPTGRFRLSEQSQFIPLWRRCQLPEVHLSEYSKRMGNLKQLLYTADPHPKRTGFLVLRSIAPLNYSAADVRAAFAPESGEDLASVTPKPCQSGANGMPKPRQRTMPKEIEQTFTSTGFEADSGTGAIGYEHRLTRRGGGTKALQALSVPREEQSFVQFREELGRDYGAMDGEAAERFAEEFEKAWPH